MPAANAVVYSASSEGAETAAASAWRATDKLYAALLLGTAGVAAGVRFNDQLIGLTGDNAQYILLSQALLTGKTYANAEYPWGYPALIAPVLAVVGPANLTSAIPWLKLLTILLFLASVVLVYAVLRPGRASLTAFGASLFYAINGTAILYANDIMTEIPYACASFGAILFWQHKVDPHIRERSPALSWRVLVLAGALIGLCYYLRTVGMALMAASVLVFLLRLRLKESFALALLLFAVGLPWLIFSNGGDQPNYVSKLLLRDPYNPSLGRVSSPWEFALRIAQSADLYIDGVFPAMVLPAPVPDRARAVLTPVLVVLLVTGFAYSNRHGPGLREIYLLLFLFVLCAWPWKADRFLLPVYPLLIFYVLEGGRLLAHLPAMRGPVTRKALRLGAVGVLFLLAAPNLWVAGEAGAANLSYLQGKSQPEGRTPDWQSYFAACDWLRLNTPPGSMVLSRKSTLTAIYAERPSVLIPLIPSDQYQAFLDRNNVTYILEDGFDWSTQTRDYLRPALRANLARLELVKMVGPVATRIWRVRR